MASSEGRVVVFSCVPGGAPQSPRDSSIPMVIQMTLLNLWESQKRLRYKKWMKRWGSNRDWGVREDVVTVIRM